MADTRLPEPWLRGTHSEIPPVQRAVLHALELAKEELQEWCGNLSDEQLNARPANLASVAFHIRHIARSIDRLLMYAEGKELNSEQIAAIKTELDRGAKQDELFEELEAALASAATRIRSIKSSALDESRTVGTKHLPTTVAGLLVHVADHTQRHVGQAISTAQLVTFETR
jgi:uncharacterized damage-inducible protein DinB